MAWPPKGHLNKYLYLIVETDSDNSLRKSLNYNHAAKGSDPDPSPAPLCVFWTIESGVISLVLQYETCQECEDN